MKKNSKKRITNIYINRSISHTRRYDSLKEVAEDLGCQPNRRAVINKCRSLNFERVQFWYSSSNFEEINLIKED